MASFPFTFTFSFFFAQLQLVGPSANDDSQIAHGLVHVQRCVDPPVAVFEHSLSLPERFSCGSHLDLRPVPLAALQARKGRGGVLGIGGYHFPINVALVRLVAVQISAVQQVA